MGRGKKKSTRGLAPVTSALLPLQEKDGEERKKKKKCNRIYCHVHPCIQTCRDANATKRQAREKERRTRRRKKGKKRGREGKTSLCLDRRRPKRGDGERGEREGNRNAKQPILFVPSSARRTEHRKGERKEEGRKGDHFCKVRREGKDCKKKTKRSSRGNSSNHYSLITR